MATYKFGSGDLIDYYTGPIYRSPAFTGFPAADYNDFDSGVYVSPAIEVDILDLVRWFWRVKSWDVELDQPLNDVGYADQIFTSAATDEFGLLDLPRVLSADEIMYFGFGIVINNSGAYGVQSDLLDSGGAAIANLFSAAGSTLTFKDVDGNQAVVTESTYWDWT